jgi:hypothetical protein
MYPGDNRSEQILDFMDLKLNPTLLLFVCHNDSSNSERKGIKKLFKDESWASVSDRQLDYATFLSILKQSKFMICPKGNAIDCHRNWEVLLMRRVPVMKKDPYFENLFKDYPVLFVDDYSDITEDLLIENNHLYERALNMDISNLTLPNYFDRIVNKTLKEYARK